MSCTPRLVVAALACAALYIGCSRSPSPEAEASRPAAIGTDLPDDGSDLPIHLYWVTDSRIFRAGCTGRRPILRSNCGQDIQSMDYERFRVTLDGGLSQTIRELSEEARRIQDAIIRIESEIRSTLDTIADIERQHGTLSAEVESLRVEMRQFETFVVEYREQIALIDAALRRLANSDLATQRETIMRELADYQYRLTGIAARIQPLLDQLRGVRDQLDRLQTHLDSMNARLGNLRVELVQVSARLQTAYDDFSVYEDTLYKLDDGIIYHVLSDNVLYQKNRQFVRRFDRIFN